MQDIVMRPATKADAPGIAQLFLISSDGVAAYIWSRLAKPGEDLAAVGARRYAREGVAFSWQNCLMAERAGQVIGMLHSYPMEVDPAAEPESDPVLRPYSELEDDGSLYVSGLAVVPAERGKGLGTRMMAAAEDRARALGLPRISLLCFSRNEGAMRLYRRLGYREAGRRAVVPHPLLHFGDGDAVMLVRDVG